MPRQTVAAYVNHWVSVVGALHGTITALGGTYSPAEVSALSGHAFRLAITSSANGEIGADGPNCFPSRSALPLYAGLGWRFTAVEAAPDDAAFARRRDEALERMAKATGRGVPAVAFDLHIPDFGIVYGTEKGRQRTSLVLLVSTAMSAQYGARLPAEQWPAPGRPQPLRVFLPEKQVKVDPAARLVRLLRFAVEYARHGEPEPGPGCVAPASGLAAYARWLAVLDGDGPVSPHGQARCIQALQQARVEAATFLDAAQRSHPAAAPAFQRAAAGYRTVVLEMSRLATLFPFPNGGDVVSAGARRAGAIYLHRALTAEEQAVEALELALRG
jgi:hypothetical protein